MDKYPISVDCPECSGTEYDTRPSERRISYTSDRVCKQCGTRYTPPTPAWAAVAFIVVGLVIAGCCVFAIGGAAGSPGGLLSVGFLGIVGVFAVRHGLLALMRPGRV